MLRFLIASGPTREPIDPVRFISNYSTGVMGRELVRAARNKGHKVTFVECPRDAQTALELRAKLNRLLPRQDVFVMAAAVSDARPINVSRTKIKKESFSTIKLAKNPDILAGLAKQKKKSQVFMGFGLESSDLLKNGYEKLKSKGLEAIVLQRVTSRHSPFGEKSIEAFVLRKDGSHQKFSSISKPKLARYLVSEAERLSRVKLGDGA